MGTEGPAYSANTLSWYPCALSVTHEIHLNCHFTLTLTLSIPGMVGFFQVFRFVICAFKHRSGISATTKGPGFATWRTPKENRILEYVYALNQIYYQLPAQP